MAPVAPVLFVGGSEGPWQVRSIRAVRGDSLAAAARLDRREGASTPAPGGAWSLRGVAGHERYVVRAELIPIRKSEAWWALAQDERRAIVEERSHHIATGLRFLPAIARRLYHSRDLGEPFDFLTWFEFAASDEPAFDELVATLRATEEWSWVEREVDVRLER